MGTSKAKLYAKVGRFVSVASMLVALSVAVAYGDFVDYSTVDAHEELNRLFGLYQLHWDESYYRSQFSLKEKLVLVNTTSLSGSKFNIHRYYYLPMLDDSKYFLIVSREEKKDFENDMNTNIFEWGYLFDNHMSFSITGEPTQDKSYSDLAFTLRSFGKKDRTLLRFWWLNYLFNEKNKEAKLYSTYPTRFDLLWFGEYGSQKWYVAMELGNRSRFVDNSDPLDPKVFVIKNDKYKIVYMDSVGKYDFGTSMEMIKGRENEKEYTKYNVEPHINVTLNEDLMLENYLSFIGVEYTSDGNNMIRNLYGALKTLLMHRKNEGFYIQYGYAGLYAKTQKELSNKVIINFVWKTASMGEFRIINSFKPTKSIWPMLWHGSGVQYVYSF